MKKHEGPILFVRKRPIIIGGMLTHKIHKCETVIGVFGRSTILPQGKPAETTVIILDKFSVGFDALFLRQPKQIALANHLTNEVVVVCFGSVQA